METNLDKELLERINKKLGHFLILNEVATKQQARTMSKKQKVAMQEDKEELQFCIEGLSKIIEKL